MTFGSLLKEAQLGDWVPDGPFLNLKPTWRQILLWVSGQTAVIPSLTSMRELNPVVRFLRKFNVKVIMGEYLAASLPWLQISQDLGIRFIAHAHGSDVSARLCQPKWRAEYLRYNGTTGVITMSQVSRARLIDIGLLPNKIHIVPYGVDVPVEPSLRSRGRVVRCLAVGRLVVKKAPLLTLEAFRLATESYPDIQLDYIGGGELLPKARQFIHDFGLEDKVTLHGSQPNNVVQRMMKDADIFLQHSITDPETGDEEGLPVAILEAIAHTLPVVSTRHAGIPEAVIDGSTGYLVDERDSKGMAEGIANLIRDPDLCQQMGREGWARARDHFSWERERAALLRILGLESPKEGDISMLLTIP